MKESLIAIIVLLGLSSLYMYSLVAGVIVSVIFFGYLRSYSYKVGANNLKQK